MKRLLICFSALIVIPVFLMGQKVINERDVPERILKDFNRRVPEAKNPKWEQLDSAVYVATYILNDTKTSIKFNKVSTETRWDVDLKWAPESIKHYVDSVYTKAKIESICIADVQNKKAYEAVIKQKKNQFLLRFETDGKFIDVTEMNPKKKK